jgi:hypothetical protein
MSLPSQATVSVHNKAKIRHGTRGEKGGKNEIRLKIVRQVLLAFPELDHSLGLGERRQTYEGMLGQLRHDRFHMRFTVEAWKYLGEDVVCCDCESVRCCRNDTASGRR